MGGGRENCKLGVDGTWLYCEKAVLSKGDGVPLEKLGVLKFRSDAVLIDIDSDSAVW